MAEQYNVKLDLFEGPLDLLLHLINRLEIDIYDIPVAEITEQYLLYIQTMKELELNVASEYLVMAATLLAIKSKMLLPQQENELDDDLTFEVEEDPREELVARLIEYRKYKEAASELKELEEERNLMYTRPPINFDEYTKDSPIEKMDLNVNVYDMIRAYQRLLQRKRLQTPKFAKISRQEISIEERMDEIIIFLRKTKKRVHFFELFPYPEKEQIVTTFLALLELMKRKEIIVWQEQNFSDIYIKGKE